MKQFAAYQDARDYAQTLANETQIACGIEKETSAWHTVYVVRILPRPENRCGSELRCEVVQPTGAPPEAPQPCGWIDPGLRPRKAARR